MFNVVEFNDGLAIVPSEWLFSDNKFCKWPPYQSQKKITNAQKKKEVPAHNWPMYEVTKIYATSELYEEAKKLLVEAKQHSDVENFVKDTNQYKKGRKSRARIKSSSSSSSESDYTNNTTVGGCILPPQLKITHDEVLHPLQSSQSQDEATNEASNGLQSVIIAQNKEIIYMLNKLIVSHGELRKEIHGLKNSKASNQEDNSDLKKTVAGFLPFESLIRIKSFNQELETNKDYEKALLQILKSLGGKDDRAKVNNILEKVMTDSLAVQFSIKGQKRKESLQSLKLFRVIIAAITECKSSSYSENEIKLQIGTWLANRKAKILRKTDKRRTVNDNEAAEAAIQLVNDNVTFNNN